jgi:NAD+ synthase (glutamine-hydrolysing)
MMAEAINLRLALAQIDPTVGDLEGNARLISESIERGREAGARLVILPELCLSGYPPEDLVLRRDFLDAVRRSLDEIAADVEGTVALVGFPERVERPANELEHFDPLIDPPPPPAYNSLAVLAGGEVRAVYRKCDLPNYGVFDERRYFEPGNEPALIEVDGALVGLTVCEDIWHPGFPESDEVAAGAHLVVNSSASPYHRGKGRARESMVADRARSNGAAFALCNMVGGQDELVFDGASVVIGPDGETLARAAQFEPELLVCDLTVQASGDSSDGAGSARQVPVLAELSSGAKPEGDVEPRVAQPLAHEEAEVYGALTLGLRDYVEKNGFERVVIALSGGIDSALVALIAVDALGADRVSVVVMPSPNSSEETQSDAREIAANLGVELIEISIAEAMEAYERALASSFEGAEPGLAEENLQARIRGNLVMALSNKFGWLVLTTGNKSEISVGYATLYGDMAGGFAVIKDIFKLLVYRLARWRNEQSELVPASVLDRPPSAELRPGQLDEDSLPPYETLDRILEAYVERDEGVEELVAQGLPEEVVLEVIRLVDRAEYKRRQAPPGIRVSNKAFGRDRRLPITNRFGSMRALRR